MNNSKRHKDIRTRVKSFEETMLDQRLSAANQRMNDAFKTLQETHKVDGFGPIYQLVRTIEQASWEIGVLEALIHKEGD